VRRYRIVICRGPECGDRRGSAALHDAFCSALDAGGVRESCEVVWQSCFGRCTQGPNVLVRELLPPVAASQSSQFGFGLATLPGPRGTTALYNRVDRERVERVVALHIVAGQIVREYIERPGIHPLEPVASRSKDS
jgi:(2Fe-2S) ferredoxin